MRNAAAAVIVGNGVAGITAARTLSNAKVEVEIYTQEAIDRSVFGSPSYFVDGDMFYGQDRLEMVERALDRPYR